VFSGIKTIHYLFCDARLDRLPAENLKLQHRFERSMQARGQTRLPTASWELSELTDRGHGGVLHSPPEARNDQHTGSNRTKEPDDGDRKGNGERGSRSNLFLPLRVGSVGEHAAL